MTPMPIRTLIVDDDFRVASIHAAYVDRVSGFDVIGQAHTAAEARTMIDRLRPDAVLMDVYLPDGSGLDVMRALVDSAARPDFIVITAARDVTTVRSAMQLGCIHYLVKPFGFTALNERLCSYRQLRERMSNLEDDAAQSDVDELFSILHSGHAAGGVPPKGHSAPTMDLVRNAVRAATDDISASEVADAIGISRATAQRYLSHLTTTGAVHLRLRYGSTGRPEHRYTI